MKKRFEEASSLRMRASWKNALYLAGLVIGILLFSLQVVSGYQAVAATSASTNLSVLLVGWMTIILAFLIQMMTWRKLMRELGCRLPRLNVIQWYPITFLPRYIPGTIWGYLTRGQWLYRDHQIPYVTSSIGSLYEILTSLVSVVFIIGFVGTFLREQWGCSLLGASVFLFVGSWYILHKIEKIPLVGHHFRLSPLGINSHDPRVRFLDWMKAVLGYILLWLCYGFMLFVIASISLQDTKLSVISCTLLYGISWLIGFFVVFIPAGLGLRELVLTYLFMMYIGADFGTASFISVTSRFLVVLGELAWVVIGIILGFSRHEV